MRTCVLPLLKTKIYYWTLPRHMHYYITQVVNCIFKVQFGVQLYFIPLFLLLYNNLFFFLLRRLVLLIAVVL